MTGYEVFNPNDLSDLDGNRTLPRSVYLKRDLRALMTCDALVLLPGWGNSAGCRMEAHVAQELRIPVFAWQEAWDTEGCPRIGVRFLAEGGSVSEREDQYGSLLREVYEQYKNMDKILSDREWWAESSQGRIIYDLWQAVKGAVTGAATAGPCTRSAREENFGEQRKKQPLPCPGGELVTPRLKEMLPRLIEERERKGIATYGQSLGTWNGRNVSRDIMGELVDALQYAFQAEMERHDLVRWLREALALAEEAVDFANLAPSLSDEKYQELARREVALQEKAAKARPR